MRISKTALWLSVIDALAVVLAPTQSGLDRTPTFDLDHSTRPHAEQEPVRAATDHSCYTSIRPAGCASLPAQQRPINHLPDYTPHWGQRSDRTIAPKALSVLSNHAPSAHPCLGYHHNWAAPDPGGDQSGEYTSSVACALRASVRTRHGTSPPRK